MKTLTNNRILKILIVGFLAITLCALSTLCLSQSKTQTASAKNASAETIDDSYLVMKGTPGTVELSNFIKIAMEPIGHSMYIYGGGWNEADNGGGIEANTIGVAKSWKDFERKQDKSYTNLIEPLNYEFHKEVIHYGLDCSAYLGWVYFNMFNDSKDHVTYASRMGDELVSPKECATKTRDTKAGTGSNKFTPGDILTSVGHCWICLGKCSDGSVLTLQSQGVSDASELDKYEGVSIYGTKTPDGSKDSEAIALANEYLNRYYTNFNAKYQKGYSNTNFLTDFDEYTWNSNLDKSGLQNMDAPHVMASLFNETSANVNCSATGTMPTIKINRATVTPNTNTAQKYDKSSEHPTTVDITLKIPFDQQFNSISINSTDYSSQIPTTKEQLCTNYDDGYTHVKIEGIASADTYSITTSTTAATTYGVGKTTWEYESATENNSVQTNAQNTQNTNAISHIENATISIESVIVDGKEVTEPVYYSGCDWVNDSKNGYGAFPVDSTVKMQIIAADGYRVDSVNAVPANSVNNSATNSISNAYTINSETIVTATQTNNNEYTIVAPGGPFKLEVNTSKIEDVNPVEPVSESEAIATQSAKTGDPITDFVYRFFFRIIS